MYPLDQGKWGPTVRIGHLRDELGELAELDVLHGYRGARRRALGRYAFSGRLRRLDGIYVESSSFLPAEADLAFLGLARALGVPVLTYVRDAYQLFPDEYALGSWRARAAARAFRPMVRGLDAVSTRLAFPTRGLAEAVLGSRADQAVLLPPGAPAPVDVPRAGTADRLLFVGDARLPVQGGSRLVAAVERARQGGVEVELTVVSRPGQEPAPPHPDWLRVERAEGEAIHALLPGIIGTVIPRPLGEYNHLALPVKLFDYLSYGRPLLVTDCLEQARVVREADAGIVVGDTVDALAAGVAMLARAPSDALDRWSANAAAGAEASSWRHRARSIVALLAAARG